MRRGRGPCHRFPDRPQNRQEGGLNPVALLPCNPSAPAKYEWLSLSYPFQTEPQSQETLNSFRQMAKKLGLTVAVG
ncbi:MAG: hypothetical protein IT210_24315 [Armatimonadetes bacterium]|nr:hypothetical protein [Armatimonadota bacterium]